MVDESRVVQAIYSSIDRTNETREPNQQIEKSPQTLLAGVEGGLDSLGFVTLSVAVEEEVEQQFGRQIVIIDLLEAEPQERLTISTLGAMIARQLA